MELETVVASEFIARVVLRDDLRSVSAVWYMAEERGFCPSFLFSVIYSPVLFFIFL
jgi:hypothetical protein